MTQANNVAIESSQINSSGVLQPAGGGTGVTTTTGSGNAVLSTSPTLVTPALGTPSAIILTNATSVPVNQATGTLPVANGGTGAATLTANNVLLGNGTSALQVVAPGTSGNLLTSNGTTWVSSTPAGGGVTSAVAGNGIAVSGATGAVTFSAACPTFNTVGSYVFIVYNYNGASYPSGGTNLSAGTGSGQVQALSINDTNPFTYQASNTLSGTWKWMGGAPGSNYNLYFAIGCRVS